MFGKPKDLDRVVRSRARDRARWAIRDHGAEAEAIIQHKLDRPGLSDADRILHRLTLRIIGEIRRQESRALVARDTQPPAIVGLLTSLFGKRRKRRRRRS